MFAFFALHFTNSSRLRWEGNRVFSGYRNFFVTLSLEKAIKGVTKSNHSVQIPSYKSPIHVSIYSLSSSSSKSSSLAKIRFLAFRRRFCQIWSCFHFLGFRNNTYFDRARWSSLRPTQNLGRQVSLFMSPNNTPRHWVPFSSPSTAHRAMI
jgi:hypothetical protein